MKTRKIYLLVIACFILLFLSAGPARSQETIEVKTERAQMSKGMQTAYIVNIPMVTLKNVQQDWIKKLQENIKAKVEKIKDELVLANVVKSEISPDTISIYTLFIEKEGHLVMNVFVEKAKIFFEPKEDKTDLSAEKTDNNIKNYIRNFAVDQYRLVAGDALETEQKKLDKMQSDLDKLVKENESLKKDISSQENNIDKTGREVTDLDNQIDLKNKEILAHSTSMQTLVLEDEKTAAREKQKELDKDKNKLEKERSKAKNDISDMKARIEKDNKDITENEKLQEEKQAEITQQKETVNAAQTTLGGIK